MNSAEVKQLLNGRMEEICNLLLPSGRRRGSEWCVGSISGEAGDSMQVHLDGERAGVWRDFASGPDDKGDVFDLWGKVRGLTFVDTLKQCKDFLGVADVTSGSFFPARQRKYVKPSMDVIEPMQSGGPVYEYLTKARLIYPEVIEAYKVGQFTSSTHGPSVVFPCYDPSGRDVDLIKFLATQRPQGKKIVWSSQESKPRLFGWQAIKPDARSVIITEGEIDALTVAGFGGAALSVPQGCVNMEWIEQDYDDLQRFEKIYLCLDMDDPGEKAAREISERLGRDRCYRVRLDGFKDINEAHCSGRFEGPDFDSLLDSAKTYDPIELRGAEEFSDKAWERLHPTDKKSAGTEPPIDIPWRCRHGELTIWTGFSGHGKSAILNQFLLHDAHQGEKIFVCSLEIPAGSTTALLARMALGYWPTKEQKEKFDHAIAWLGNKFWIFNKVGATHWSKILPVMEYAARRYGCTRFAIDSFLMCGIAEDDYNAQKEFIGVLTSFAAQFGHVHLVCHSRKKEDESRSPGKLDVRGSGSITDMAHNGFTMWRNKAKEQKLEEFINGVDDSGGSDRAKWESKKDAQITQWKNRETGEEPYRNLWFHRGSGQFLQRPMDRPRCYVT